MCCKTNNFRPYITVKHKQSIKNAERGLQHNQNQKVLKYFEI